MSDNKDYKDNVVNDKIKKTKQKLRSGTRSFEVSSIIEDGIKDGLIEKGLVNENDSESDGSSEQYRDYYEEKELEQEKNNFQEAENTKNNTQQRNSGFKRDRELAFNPVESKKETDLEVSEIDEIEDPQNLHSKESVKKRRGKFSSVFHQWLHSFKRAVHHVAETFEILDRIEAVQKVQVKIQKLIEKLSTYRYHSIRTPGDQAGIFDDKTEAIKAKAEIKSEIASKIAATAVIKKGAESAFKAGEQVARQAIDAQAAQYQAKVDAAMKQAEAAMKTAQTVQQVAEQAANLSAKLQAASQQQQQRSAEQFTARESSLGTLKSSYVEAVQASVEQAKSGGRGI